MFGIKKRSSFDNSQAILRISDTVIALEALKKRYLSDAEGSDGLVAIYRSAAENVTVCIVLLKEAAVTLEISLPPRNARRAKELMRKQSQLIEDIDASIVGAELFTSRIEEKVLPLVRALNALVREGTEV